MGEPGLVPGSGRGGGGLMVVEVGRATLGLGAGEAGRDPARPPATADVDPRLGTTVASPSDCISIRNHHQLATVPAF